MKMFGFELSLNEMNQIVDAISERMNRDRNAVCLLLHFCNEFMKDWYNDINANFIPLVIKGGFTDLAEPEKTKLFIFITQSVQVPVADMLLFHLNRVIGTSSELSGSDKEKISEIIEYLKRFKEFAIVKNEWYHKASQRDFSWDLDLQKFTSWQSELYNLTLETNNRKLDLGDSLNCHHNNMRNLLREYQR